MNLKGSQIATIATTFVVGFLAGVLIAPSSGEKTRRRIGLNARRQLDQAEKKLEALERQLADLNEQFGNTTNDLSGKLRKVAKETVDQHLPDLSLPDEKWDLNDDEVKRELRNIAR